MRQRGASPRSRQLCAVVLAHAAAILSTLHAAAPTPGVPSLNPAAPVPVLNAPVESTSATAPAGMELRYEQTFATPQALGDFVCTDPATWTWTAIPGGGCLDLVDQAKYQPPVRSPINIALLADRAFGDFVLEAEVMQTGKEYGHRDFCLFFGFQNPTNFYYVHLASQTDEHAHNLFIVHNAPRTKISRRTTEGVAWGTNAWHRVRLERRLADGEIRVWFDDLQTPIMAAQDTTHGAGYVGFGSFDDTGRIRRLRVWSPNPPIARKTGFFAAPKSAP